MKRSALPILIAACLILLPSCSKRGSEGLLQDKIETHLELGHPAFYWETTEGKTSVFHIFENTSEIDTFFTDLEDFRAIGASSTSIYTLDDNYEGHLRLTRIESDTYMITNATLESKLIASRPKPWVISRNDIVMLSGTNEAGTNSVIAVTFSCRIPERTYRRDENLDPIISYEETEWLTTSSNIEDMVISVDGSMIALIIPMDDGSGYSGLYFLREPGGELEMVSEVPVFEIGDFSPDGTKFLATFGHDRRVDLYIIDTETLEFEAVTEVAIGYIAGNPAWHPEGRYLLYTTDFTSEFISDSTPLRGKQLYLYSMESRNERRLTAFTDTTILVDFSPSGDFLLYASTPGVVRRVGSRAREEDAENAESSEDLETWRLYYVPWVDEFFKSHVTDLLTPDEMQFMVSWVVGDTSDEFGFAWGPG